MGFLSWGDDKPTKRTLGIRDRQILWIKAEKKCENCGKSLEFHEMQIGHKKAYSRGGSTTMKNSVCLCYACNKLQGTDTWEVFQKKQGKKIEVSDSSKVKAQLKGLNLTKLKFLAKKYNITVKGITESSFFGDKYIPPSKSQYVKALTSKISEDQINSALKET
jgi:hypothetical protein